MPRLELRLLGPPEARVDGSPARFKTRKALVLLAYLAAEGGAHAREKLAGLLWPDSAPGVARSALRNAVLHARTALGPAADRLVADRETLAWRPSPDDAIDLLALEAGDAAAHGGAFLEGFGPDGPGGGEFEAWLAGRREAAHAAADRALDRASARLMPGDPEGAAALAGRWVALDRLNEAAWRRVAGAWLRAGRPALARDAIEACARTLREELGADPAPETLALLDRLAAPETAAAPGRAAPAPPPERPVGRAREWAALVAHLDAARAGEVRAVALVGEPGIGKTRLASALLDRAREFAAFERTGTPLVGRAFEGGGAPFAVWADALRGAPGGAAAVAGRLDPAWRAELARLLPELRGPLPPAPDDAGDAPGRAFEALTRAALAAAGDGPVVLLLDDLPWADAPSRDAAAHLARRLRQEGRGGLLLFTARAEALVGVSAPAAWLTRLGRDVPVARLDLGPLSGEETLALVARGAGGADAREVAAWLHAHTGGHPLYLTEALRDLREGGAIEARGGAWRLSADRAAGELNGVRAVIAERLSRLPAAALAVAHASAALGDPAPFDVLRRVADLAEGDALSGLDALLAAGLLREAPGGPEDAYAISHDRVRETLRAGWSAARRRALHARALAALEGAAPPRVLARHARSAGHTEEARRHLRDAARDLLRLGFAREARAALDEALALGAEGAERAELLLEAAEASEVFGDVEAQNGAGREALDLGRALGDPSLSARALNRLAWASPDAEGPERRALSEEAVRLARGTGDDLLLAASLQGLARSFRREDPRRSHALQTEAMAALERAGDPRRLGFGHMNAAYTHRALGESAAWLAHLRLALECFRSAGQRFHEAQTGAVLGAALLDTGEDAEAERLFAGATALREGQIPRAPVFRAGWAVALGRLGDPERGRRALHEGLTLPPPEGALPPLLAWAAEFLAVHGSPETAAVLCAALERHGVGFTGMAEGGWRRARAALDAGGVRAEETPDLTAALARLVAELG